MIFYITGSPPSSPLPSCIFSPFEVEQYPFSKPICDENEGGCQILPKGISLLQILLTLLTLVNYLFIKCFPLLLELLQICYAIFSGPSRRPNPYIPLPNSRMDMTGQVETTYMDLYDETKVGLQKGHQDDWNHSVCRKWYSIITMHPMRAPHSDACQSESEAWSFLHIQEPLS